VILSAEWSEQIGHGLPNPTFFAIPLTKLVLPSLGNHTATAVCQAVIPLIFNEITTSNWMLYYFNSVFTSKINKISKKTIKIKKKNCIFIDFLCEFTVKIIEHTGASYESSDFT
jgi:hypothetical protein